MTAPAPGLDLPPAAGPAPRANGDPLERLHREHLGFRLLCDELDALAAAERPDPAGAAAALLALCHILPLHEKAETEELFPRLRRAAAAGDGIAAWLDRLEADHAARDGGARAAQATLTGMAGGALPGADGRTALADFAAAKRRHLRLEDAMLLPLARLRLGATDRAALAAHLDARPLLPGTAAAG